MRIDSFRVVPALPEALKGLRDLAYNLLWSWDDEIRVLFTRMDLELWNATYQNPVLMLGQISQHRLDELTKDDGFMAFYERTLERLQDYKDEPTWWDKRFDDRPLVAYFSAEYGLAECLPVYSGGLGVLAGHHLKSASDLGVPLVGVGLLYQQGYFRQYLTSDGWQQERYPTNDFYNLPLQPQARADGSPLKVGIRMAGQDLLVQVWRVDVGRLPLYLLDTNLPENPADLRPITDHLYGGDSETRIRQEIVLGMAGFRALLEMGLSPVVCHMNEGHAAFLALERIRTLVKAHGLTFPEALEAARAGCIFTSHTPVPAGFDIFSGELMDRYFAEYREEVGVSRKRFMALGSGDANGGDDSFNMAALALRSSAMANGVSELHGHVSRALLSRVSPAIPVDEVPISHVTNGAHTRSSVSREMATLFDRYLGGDWWRRPGQPSTWNNVDSIPDEELWATHERRRERLVAFARQRLMKQVLSRGGSQRDVERARGVLSSRALTIGFARRFATYKRGTLIMRDPERLARILLNAERPVQIIFAGKAHPKDHEAKEVLKAVFEFCQREDVRPHALFLEDYDLAVARYLVQGVDVWLNTPRRLMEASGTSGMKVLPNGGLNLSTLDGWWAEAYQPEMGWAIGKGETYSDYAYQDYVESNALYELLEKEVVPLFYQRSADGLPRPWIARMKRSMKTLSPQFSCNRMIWEYCERFYVPAARYHRELMADGAARARKLADWKKEILRSWSAVAVLSVEAMAPGVRTIGEGFEVRALVDLGAIPPDEVLVEVYHGPLDSAGEITRARSVPMGLSESRGDGTHVYVGSVPCDRTGMQGYTVRVRPEHPDANNLIVTGLMTWR